MAIRVKEINLERGNPTSQEALKNMVNMIYTAKSTGYKSVILIHGYGSSGQGGAIRRALLSKLEEPMFRGLVDDYVEGRNWEDKKKRFLDECPQLKEYEDRIKGNKGITVILFKR